MLACSQPKVSCRIVGHVPWLQLPEWIIMFIPSPVNNHSSIYTIHGIWLVTWDHTQFSLLSSCQICCDTPEHGYLRTRKEQHQKLVSMNLVNH